jgi:phospholipase C
VRNSTLLVITYDEHGGTYDHVVPPTTVNPDGKVWTNDGVSLDPSFDFTRLGVRVPTVLISPYIAPGIDHRIYDHTSIIATTFKHFLPDVSGVNLTLRDKLANTFEDNFTLAEPRSENIDLGAGAQSQPPTAADLAQPLNDHLKALVHQAALSEQRLPLDQQSGIDPNTITTEAQASKYLKGVHAKLHAKGNSSND